MNNLGIYKEGGGSTKDKIISIATSLFTKANYEAVSMSDISNKLKISKAALYHHFKSKDEIFFRVLNDGFNEFSKEINKVFEKDISLDKKFREFITVYINLCLKRGNLTRLMMQRISKGDKKITKILDKLKDKVVAQIEPLVKEILEFRGFPEKVDSRMVTFLVLGVLHTVVANEFIMGKSDWSADQVADQITALVLNK